MSLLFVGLVACASGTPQIGPSDAPAQSLAPVVIDIRSQDVRLAIGQELVATSNAAKWTPSFDASILELVSPRVDDAASEFRFRARAAGSTEVSFVGQVAASCPDPPNCPPPPSPPTIVVQVTVTR